MVFLWTAKSPVRYDADGSYRPLVELADPGWAAEPPSAEPPVVLLGRDHAEPRAVSVAALSDQAGLAMSPGTGETGQLDVNEDCALIAAGRGGHLLAVVDGHGGVDAAEAAVEGVLSGRVAMNDGWSTPELVVRWAVDAARTAVTERLAQVEGPRRGSRTALSVALVTGTRLVTVTYGDTNVLLARGRRLKRLSTWAPLLGPRSPGVDARVARLRRGDRVVLVTPGVTDALGDELAAVVTGPTTAAPDGAERLVRAALSRPAAGNVTAAVLQLSARH